MNTDTAETVRRLLAERRGQGFPDRVEDPVTLALLAGLIAEPALSIERGPRQISKPKAAEQEASGNVARSA